jgi:hypothetical protein
VLQGEAMMLELIAEIGIGFIVVPWCAFITVSIFNQKQEIALMKKNHEDLKEMIQTLIDVFKHQTKVSRKK